MLAQDVPIGSIETFGKEKINMTKNADGGVEIEFNGKTAKVIESDIMASNGVIHVIDNLLM